MPRRTTDRVEIVIITRITRRGMATTIITTIATIMRGICSACCLSRSYTTIKYNTLLLEPITIIKRERERKKERMKGNEERRKKNNKTE